MLTPWRLLCCAACILLSGCSYLFGNQGQFRDRSMDYQQAQSIEPLTLPGDIETSAIGQRYPIPEVGKAEPFVPEDSDQVPRPQSLLNVDEYGGIELRQDEHRIWLVVSRSPSEVFGLVKQFVETSGLSLAFADPHAGAIETGWLEPRRTEKDRGFWKSIGRFFTGGDKHKRERFRFLVSPEQNATGALVNISHVKVKQPVPEQVAWVDNKASDVDIITLVSDELMDFLAEAGQRAGASILSQNLRALPKYTMTWDGNGYPVLVINQDFNHAWLIVGSALLEAELAVADLDRSLGVYYLKPLNLPQIDQAQELQVRLVRSESGIQVSVQIDDDTLAEKELSAAILNRLRAALE